MLGLYLVLTRLLGRSEMKVMITSVGEWHKLSLATGLPVGLNSNDFHRVLQWICTFECIIFK